jgi:Domain of unknown function (DUF4129)
MRAAGHRRLPYRRPRGPGGPLARLAVAAGLLVLAALGAAARRVTHLSTVGVLASAVQPVAVTAGLVAVIAGCLVLVGLIVLLVRRRRPAEDEPEADQVPIPWWARVIALLALLALLALPIAALVTLARKRHGGQPGPAPVLAPPVLPRVTGPAPPAGAGGAAVLAAVAVVIVAVLAAAMLWLRRRARARAVSQRQPGQAAPLAAAVAAGSTALGAAADARAAIIACYAAMEDTLAGAGSPRRAADTPEDLLRRAEGNGIIRTSAARRLTALFREARFSPHELADAQRQAARVALDDISNDLAGGP